MRIERVLKESSAFAAATVLSCGGSQVFGLVKGVVDLVHLVKRTLQRDQLKGQERKIKADWQNFTSTPTYNLMRQRLQKEVVTQEQALAFLQAKKRVNRDKMNRLGKFLLADLVAFVPLLGAHLSWRIATAYNGPSFTPIVTRATAQSLEHFEKKLVKEVFPQSDKNHPKTNSPKQIDIPVETATKKRTIEAHYRKAYHANNSTSIDKSPTVVLFHGNGHTGKDMHEFCHLYTEKGYNVLSVTIGGYQGSPGVSSSETSVYQDVEAVKLFLKSKGVTEVGYHGLSLGGASAFQAAVGKTNVEFKTLFVVADQTYTSPKDVGGNIAANIVSLGKAIGRGAVEAAMPTGRLIELPGGKWIPSDGFNNLAKVKELSRRNIPLYAIRMSHDFLMGRNPVKLSKQSAPATQSKGTIAQRITAFVERQKNREFKDNCADDLIKARYDSKKAQSVHTYSQIGEHGTPVDEEFFNLIPQGRKRTWADLFDRWSLMESEAVD